MSFRKNHSFKNNGSKQSTLNPICVTSLDKSNDLGKRSVLDLKIGELGYVKSFGNLLCACKLLTLGLLPKSKVTVVRKSPLGDALYLQLDGHKIAIRNNEAAAILIEE